MNASLIPDYIVRVKHKDKKQEFYKIFIDFNSEPIQKSLYNVIEKYNKKFPNAHITPLYLDYNVKEKIFEYIVFTP